MLTIRKLGMAAAALALPLLLVACGEGGGEEVQRLAESVQGRVQTLTQDPIREAGLTSVADLPDPPEGQVTVQLRWRYQGDPLAGDGLVAYETVPETDGLFTMESLPAGKPVPRGDLIQDGIVFMKPGDEIHVEFVYENPSDKDVSFVALAWYVEPYSVKPFTYPTCLCISIPYTAPAGGAWYRTIYFELSPDIEPGTKMAVTWTAVTDRSQWALLPGEEPPPEVSAQPTPTAETPTATPTETPAETPTETPAAAVTLNIVGKNIQFDKGKLEVSANTPFTIVFDHQDEGIPHNFAIYRMGPPASDLVTKTEIETGPVIQELDVDGLPAGSYFYQCDVHPTTMTGILEVE